MEWHFCDCGFYSNKLISSNLTPIQEEGGNVSHASGDTAAAHETYDVVTASSPSLSLRPRKASVFCGFLFAFSLFLAAVSGLLYGTRVGAALSLALSEPFIPALSRRS